MKVREKFTIIFYQKVFQLKSLGLFLKIRYKIALMVEWGFQQGPVCIGTFMKFNKFSRHFSWLWRWVIYLEINLFKYNLIVTIWMQGWGAPDSTTRLGCVLIIKSMHKEEDCKNISTSVNYLN